VAHADICKDIYDVHIRKPLGYLPHKSLSIYHVFKLVLRDGKFTSGLWPHAKTFFSVQPSPGWQSR